MFQSFQPDLQNKVEDSKTDSEDSENVQEVKPYCTNQQLDDWLLTRYPGQKLPFNFFFGILERKHLIDPPLCLCDDCVEKLYTLSSEEVCVGTVKYPVFEKKEFNDKMVEMYDVILFSPSKLIKTTAIVCVFRCIYANQWSIQDSITFRETVKSKLEEFMKEDFEPIVFISTMFYNSMFKNKDFHEDATNNEAVQEHEDTLEGIQESIKDIEAMAKILEIVRGSKIAS